MVTIAVLIAANVALWLSGAHAADRIDRIAQNYRTAKKVVYAVFPDSRQAYALRIVGCETGHTYSRWVTGAAGERGYFQIHPSNAGRVLRDPRTGKRVGRIEFSRMYQPWANTWVAYYMSRGGRDWHEWTCSRIVG